MLSTYKEEMQRLVLLMSVILSMSSSQGFYGHDESETRHFGKAIILPGRKHLLIIKQLKSYRTLAWKKINYVNIPEADARLGMKDMGMNEWFINIALELFDNYRKGYVPQVYDASNR